MGMATKVKILLAARDMAIVDSADKLVPQTTRQNVTIKQKRNNLSKSDLHRIAKAISFQGVFILDDIVKKILLNQNL